MRRKLFLGMVVFLALGMTGCASSDSIAKKFMRKKKEPEHKASTVFLDEGPYQKKFSNDYYYKTHYTLWKSWQGEIVDNLNGNAKRLERSAEEAYSHLEQMSRYLQPEKKAELMPLVEELDKYRTKITNGTLSRSEAMSLRSDLERLERLVANDFYYDKVKDQLVADQVDLS